MAGGPAPIPVALPGSGYERKGIRGQGSWGSCGWLRRRCSLSRLWFAASGFSYHQVAGRRWSPGVRLRCRSLGTPRKLGKQLNRVILTTQTSPGPPSSSPGVQRRQADGRGSPSAFERQARTIGLKQPLLVASGKTEPKGAGLGPTSVCIFLSPHQCSPCHFLTLKPSFLLPPLG